MLHELLFCLYGNSQYISSESQLIDPSTCWKKEEMATARKFEEYFPFMHPSEKQIVKKILRISLAYKKIEIFGDRYRFYESSNSEADLSKLPTGQYLTAFATAIFEETKPYKKKIIFLEDKILHEPNTSLSSLLLGIEQFGSIFVELGCLIDMIQEKGLHGCKILELIHYCVISNVGEFQQVLKRIEKAVLQVLYNQMTYWLLYGELLDPHRELFLTINSIENTVASDLSSIDPVKDAILYSTLELERRRRLCAEISLYMDMLPNFFDLYLAERVLFIGESIRFYKHEGNTIGENVLNSDRRHILQEKEKEFLDGFSKLSQSDGLCFKEFSELVESICKSISKSLYSLVTKAGLIAELKNLKEIFLLGRGELYNYFFSLVEKSVRQPSNFISSIEFNSLFQKAGREVLMEDALLEKFTLVYEGPSDNKDDIAWNKFRIDYKVQWPLHKILNSKILERYNSILGFLLNIQRMQNRLQHLWVIQKEKANNKLSKIVELHCWTLRHSMTHLICNFQYYIQVDVLDSFFTHLMDELESTEDYQHLLKTHNSFLSSLMTHCLLTHPLLFSSITAILDKINIFCSLMEQPNLCPTKDEIEEIREDFDRISSKFFCGLTVLGQHRSSHYTAQLVTRIDYNHFYSKKSLARRFINLDSFKGLEK